MLMSLLNLLLFCILQSPECFWEIDISCDYPPVARCNFTYTVDIELVQSCYEPITEWEIWQYIGHSGPGAKIDSGRGNLDEQDYTIHGQDIPCHLQGEPISIVVFVWCIGDCCNFDMETANFEIGP